MQKNQIKQNLLRFGSVILDRPFRQVDNQIAMNPREQAIPPRVVQTWEENLFGRRHANSIEEFRKLNPDLNFCLYDSTARSAYMEKWSDHPIHEVFRTAMFGPLKADIFRYCITYESGGYYFDISKGMRSSITSLHSPQTTAFLSFEGNPYEPTDGLPVDGLLLRPKNLVIQWGFGFAPKSIILENLILSIVNNFEKFKDKKFANPKAGILEFSGPFAMTRAVRKALAVDSDMVLTQLDVDFSGKGIYSLAGSGARHIKFPSYVNVKDSRLFL